MNILMANINISLSFKSIAWFFIWILVSIILIYIILILIRSYKTLKKVMKIVDDKHDQIDKVIDELPSITKNVTTISTEVAHGMQSFHNTVDNIAITSENVTETIAEKSENFSKIASLMHVISMLKELFEKYFGEDDKETDKNVIIDIDDQDSFDKNNK